MITLRVLIFLKNLIFSLIKHIISPFRLLFKFLFFKIIIKLYYLSFKLKKYQFKGKPLNFIFSQKAMHFLAILLVVSISIFSINARTQASFDPERMRESIMAKAVISDLDLLGQEELVKETADEFSFSQSGQIINYISDSHIKRPKNYLGLEEKTSKTLINGEDRESLALNRPQQIDLSYQYDEIKPEATTAIVRTEIVEYEIKSGDTVSSIAQKFGLKTNTILWANNLSSFSLIRPGNNLKILPTDGVLHTVKRGENLSYLAQRYNVSSQEIANYNNVRADSLAINQDLIIPGASRLRAPAPTPTRSPTPTVSPSPTPTPTPAPSVSGKMVWPTEGHRITQYFSWRHNGLDVANKTGTPIYAAEAGVIEYVGWSTGYGNNILIDHGGGKKTRYAHMSRMFVSAGQSVGRGAHIAAMGSTGWSTGPHLHFEVIVNGVRQNPLNYLR